MTNDGAFNLPDDNNGQLYHEILSKQYLTVYKYTEFEMLELLGLERSTYYDKKKEALDLFAICLWGYTIPSMRGLLGIGEGSLEIPDFFQIINDPTNSRL